MTDLNPSLRAAACQKERVDNTIDLEGWLMFSLSLSLFLKVSVGGSVEKGLATGDSVA